MLIPIAPLPPNPQPGSYFVRSSFFFKNLQGWRISLIRVLNLSLRFLFLAKMTKLRCGASGCAQQVKQAQAGQSPTLGAAGTYVSRPRLFRQSVFGITSWRPFCTFSAGQSHGRNFALIFFKITDEVKSCLQLLFKISYNSW